MIASMKAKEALGMADFCSQCCIDTFGSDYGDLKGLCKEDEWVTVLCEGCGPIQVDHTGKCVSRDCLHKHGESNAVSNPVELE